MPQVRIRVELFKGQESIDLARLTSLPSELERLFHSIAEDAGFLPIDNVWRASDFCDGSLEFTAATNSTVSVSAATRCSRIANAIFAGSCDEARDYGVSDRTLLRYGELSKKIKSGETIRLGAFGSARSASPRKLYPVSSETAARLTDSVKPVVEYHGALLGTIHAFYKDAEHPHFDLRDVARGELIKCYFGPTHYADVVSALRERSQFVHVSGKIRANKLTKSIESILVERLEQAEQLDDAGFESLLGAAPGLTRGKGAADFVSEAREDESKESLS